MQSVGSRRVNGRLAGPGTWYPARRAARRIGSWGGIRPQANAAESAAPGCRPLPASSPIGEVAGHPASRAGGGRAG